MSQKEVLLTRLQKIIISYIQYGIAAEDDRIPAYNLQRSVLWLISLLLPILLLLLAYNIIALYSGFTLCIAVCYITLTGLLILLNYER